jgi:hypothetical protein
MRYFRVTTDDARFPDRWFLDEPVTHDGKEIDAREFTYGRAYKGPAPARVPVQHEGRKVQFNLAAFDMPVVSNLVASLMRGIAPGEFECLPVAAGSSFHDHLIVNAVFREACVDEGRSDILRWKPEDDRPDEVGKYRMISGLTIDAGRTHERDFFRVEDWEVALIVSERIRQALEVVPDLGVVFIPVC